VSVVCLSAHTLSSLSSGHAVISVAGAKLQEDIPFVQPITRPPHKSCSRTGSRDFRSTRRDNQEYFKPQNIKVWIDFAGMGSQLRYGVSIQGETTTVFVSRLSYEDSRRLALAGIISRERTRRRQSIYGAGSLYRWFGCTSVMALNVLARNLAVSGNAAASPKRRLGAKNRLGTFAKKWSGPGGERQKSVFAVRLFNATGCCSHSADYISLRSACRITVYQASCARPYCG
jgi:hypothetical protein